MDAEFWHQRWALREIGFHQADVNPLLAAHFQQLKLPTDSRVLVPLCGKSLDLVWLLSQGYQVVGVELSEQAVTELFEALEVQPVITAVDGFSQYSAEGIDIFVGDLFALTPAQVGQVDAIYDRAAMVALPDLMRQRYTKQLRALSGTAPQLLITLEYDQQLLQGPPFSVDQANVEAHYAEHYRIAAQGYCEEQLKGIAPAREVAWLLR